MRRNKACAAVLLLLTALPVGLFPADKKEASQSGKNHPPSLRDASKSGPGPRLWSTASLMLPFAPDAATSAEEFALKSFGRDFLKDAGRIWSWPARIRTRDLLPIAGLAALTGFLIGRDESIYRSFKAYHDDHAWVRGVSPVITEWGGFGAWGTAGAFLCYGLIAKDGKAAETAVLAADAMLQGALLSFALKGLAGRQRPEYAAGVDHWSGPGGFFKRFEKGEMGHYDSFPSGHTITAFSLATVVAMQYRDTGWVPIVSYTLAAGVGLSRLTEDKHWLSDVVVGGVIGHLVGRLVVRNHRLRHHLTPVVGLDHGRPSFGISYLR